jgi:hypothetical protein
MNEIKTKTKILPNYTQIWTLHLFEDFYNIIFSPEILRALEKWSNEEQVTSKKKKKTKNPPGTEAQAYNPTQEAEIGRLEASLGKKPSQSWLGMIVYACHPRYIGKHK